MWKWHLLVVWYLGLFLMCIHGCERIAHLVSTLCWGIIKQVLNAWPDSFHISEMASCSKSARRHASLVCKRVWLTIHPRNKDAAVNLSCFIKPSPLALQCCLKHTGLKRKKTTPVYRRGIELLLRCKAVKDNRWSFLCCDNGRKIISLIHC